MKDKQLLELIYDMALNSEDQLLNEGQICLDNREFLLFGIQKLIDRITYFQGMIYHENDQGDTEFANKVIKCVESGRKIRERNEVKNEG